MQVMQRSSKLGHPIEVWMCAIYIGTGPLHTKTINVLLA